MKTYLALIRIELKLAMRNRAAMFFNYMFPLIFFFIFATSFHAEQGGAIIQIVAMVATIGVIGNGLFGAGMRAVQEREANILRRYKVTPISPLPLLTSSVVTGLLLYLPLIALMLLLAHNIYHMAVPKNLLSLFVFIAIGNMAFRSLGLIIAAVVNSMQESVILVQLAYFAMLFLSGASFPISVFPNWLQTVSQYIPASYMVTGLQGILLRRETLLQNAAACGALLVTFVVAMFIATKLFRWEKEEKIRNSAKLWLVAVIVPFLVLGTYQAYSKDNVEKAKLDERILRRSHTFLIRNARILVGDGKVIESGSLLLKDGKIAEIYEGAGPDPKSLNADPLEAAGKTIMPGMVDVHVHLGAPGGVPDAKWTPSEKTFERELAAYLFSGTTAVKSVGDGLHMALAVKKSIGSGRRLGAEVFTVGPLFTAEKGHGTEYFKNMPPQAATAALAEFTRIPKTADEGRQQVAELKKDGVDGIKAILEAGAGGMLFNRMDTGVLKGIAEGAHAANLPLAVHTGESRDVMDALAVGANSIEHGSARDLIPAETFARMAKDGVSYDPTLSVVEAFEDLSHQKTELLNRSLLLQVGPKELLDNTRKVFSKPGNWGNFPMGLHKAKANLVAAWKAGVLLVTGSDAGNMMVPHGPTVQHEMELWVAAGIPPAVALQAATWNGAKLLRADGRFGLVKKGMEANLLVLDGNPLTDIGAVSHISSVYFKGERVVRADLFEQE